MSIIEYGRLQSLIEWNCSQAARSLFLARKVAYTLAMMVLSLAEAKDKLSAVVNDVTTTHEHYTITRNGTPVAVVLPIDDLEALEETIFWLEREITRLRAGESTEDGADVSGDEMAALMERRRRESGLT